MNRCRMVTCTSSEVGQTPASRSGTAHRPVSRRLFSALSYQLISGAACAPMGLD